MDDIQTKFCTNTIGWNVQMYKWSRVYFGFSLLYSRKVVCYIMKFEIELVHLSHHDSRSRLKLYLF